MVVESVITSYLTAKGSVLKSISLPRRTWQVTATAEPVQERARCKAEREPDRSVLGAYVRTGSAATTPQMAAHGQAPALFLVGHGSRDSEGNEEFLAMAERLKDRRPERAVYSAFVELAEPLIAEELDRCVRERPRGRGRAALALFRRRPR